MKKLMNKDNQSKEIIKIGPYSYNDRELSQIIRRKMMTKTIKNKKKYNRKTKHDKNYDI